MDDNILPQSAFARNGSRRLSQKSSLNDIVSAGYAKVPPQALDLEEAVLGALLLEKDPLTNVIDFLHADCFYKESHQKIYEAISILFQRSDPVDILTVTEELRKLGNLELVGGAFYIAQLTNRVASSANTEYHARILLQKFIQRELIRISSDTINESYQETSDAFVLLDKAEKNLFEVAERGIKRNFDSMTNLISQAVKQVEEASKKGDGITGVPSGFTALDRITGGWQPSDLIILAARPGMGKTAFVLSLARNAAVNFSKPIALFTLEMSSVQMVNRLIASETGIEANKLKKGTLDAQEWKVLHQKIGKLDSAPLYIDDTPGLSIFELRAKCRRLKAQKDIQLIVIDYLQLMTASSDNNKGGNREQEISMISRSLKSIAKELNVPIIALSQLSRDVEKRPDKRPILSDLRESGAIEQDADMVMFIYRPEYYKIDTDENGESLAGLAQIIIAKHRNGSLEDVNLRFIDKLAKFTDDDRYAEPANNYPSGNARIMRSSRLNDMTDDDHSAPF